MKRRNAQNVLCRRTTFMYIVLYCSTTRVVLTQTVRCDCLQSEMYIPLMRLSTTNGGTKTISVRILLAYRFSNRLWWTTFRKYFESCTTAILRIYSENFKKKPNSCNLKHVHIYFFRIPKTIDKLFYKPSSMCVCTLISFIWWLIKRHTWCV